MRPDTTGNERIWAAAAHLAPALLVGLGPLGPLACAAIILATKGRSSPHVHLHARQSLRTQAALIVTILLTLIVGIYALENGTALAAALFVATALTSILWWGTATIRGTRRALRGEPPDTAKRTREDADEPTPS